MTSFRYASIREIHEAYLTGQASVCDVVDEFLSLIEKYNPYLHAVIEVNPDARAIAAALDEQLKTILGNRQSTKNDTDPLPLLFGIPVLLKDNIATKDKLHTSAGAAALADLSAPEDAPCAANLRQAGAVILGKANLSEFANYYTEDNPNGFSARGGQTVSPYEPVPEDLSVFELGRYNQEEHFDPSGSSSGSGVAAAAGLCTVAVGTETSGSILSPSVCNGLVGCKPTAGLVSNEAVIPISPTLDTPGPMARTFDDCARLLAALAGLSQEAFARQYPDASLMSVSDLKLGVVLPPRGEDSGKWDPSDEECDAFDALLLTLEKAGVQLMRGADRGTNNGIMDLMKYEIKGSINTFLDWANNAADCQINTLSDILDYVHSHPESSPYGHTLLEARDKDTSGKMDEPEYFEALKKRKNVQEKMDQYLKENQLDAILSIDFPIFAPFGGFPAVTIPLGLDSKGYPIGVYLFARPGEDFRLLTIGKALQTLIDPMPHPTI